MNQKRKDGLLISCAAAFSALVFLIVVYYLKKTAILDYQQWDIETLTASDFTVEYTITEDMWNLFIVQLGSHNRLPIGNSSPNH